MERQGPGAGDQQPGERARDFAGRGAEQIEALGLSDFELFRSLSGRRSLAQMTAAGLPAEALAARMATSPVPVPSYDVHEGPDLP